MPQDLLSQGIKTPVTVSLVILALSGVPYPQALKKSFQSSKAFFPVPFLSAFTQDIVSELSSSSLGDLHLIRNSQNDIFQPAAWGYGSAQHQTWGLDFFMWMFSGKAELMMFSY